MRYFSQIKESSGIFYKPPEHFNVNSGKEVLSHALGATLYMGAARKKLMKDILTTSAVSVVVCLEDSVSTSLLPEAECNVLNLFEHINRAAEEDGDFLKELPLIFIRVRSLVQLKMLLESSKMSGLCGFVFPKFNAEDGKAYLEALKEYNHQNNRNLYAMPILETPEIIYKEIRIEELIRIKYLLNTYRDMILNVRLGGTDLSGIFSLRRSRDFTIYDLTVIRDCICDVVNIFRRDGYVVSAPVNEYYDIPFDLDNNILVKEFLLDKANGLTGKTVIHPKQVNLINSLMAVSKEEYLDAEAILSSSWDGVIRSSYSNKMNEVKPHHKWAQETYLLSRITGVLNDGRDYRDILKYSNELLYRQELRSAARY